MNNHFKASWMADESLCGPKLSRLAPLKGVVREVAELMRFFAPLSKFGVALLCLTLAVTGLSTAFAEEGANKFEQTLSEDFIDDFLDKSKEGLETATLSNGLKVLFFRRVGAPVFAGAVTVQVGGVDEPKGGTGISHMFEHMAFKGNDSIGTKDYARELPLLEAEERLMRQSLGRNLSKEEQGELKSIRDQLRSLWDDEAYQRELSRRGAVGLNAQTSADQTIYYVKLPRGAFEYWCWAESERLVNPVLRQFYTERDVVLEERRMRFDDDPGGALYEKLLQVAFTKHNYRNPVIGYASDLSRLTASDLETYRQIYYVPDNIAISLVGDVDPDRDLPMLERYFGRLHVRSAPRERHEAEPPQQEERRFVIKKEASPQVLIAYHKPNYPDKRDPAITAASSILADGVTSRLFKSLVLEQQIAVGVDSEEAPGNRYPNLVIFSITPRAPHTPDEVIAAFDTVIEQFLRSQVANRQSEVKTESSGKDVSSMKSPQGMLDSDLSRELAKVKYSANVGLVSSFDDTLGWAKLLGSASLLYGDHDAIFRWYREFNELTVNDVISVAREILKSSNRTVGILEHK